MGTFGPDCFWYWLFEHFPPNILWCEERLCSLIVTPFNTWTNLGYILGGVFVGWKTRTHPNRLFRFFGQAMFWVGVSSFLYHASLNFFTQIFDFFGMYLFCFLLIMFNFDRAGKWPQGAAGLRRFWLLVIGLTVLTSVSLVIHPHFPIQLYIVSLILLIIRSEFWSPSPEGSQRRTYFWLSVLSNLIAVTFSALDATRKLCDPANHFFQGHGVWHLLQATSLLFAFKHYSFIYRMADGESPSALTHG